MPGLIERLQLAGQRPDGPHPPRPRTALLLREASYALSPITRRLARRPQIVRTADPQNVLVYPGFLAHPILMSYLAGQIRKAGHHAEHWCLGTNLGPTEARLKLLDAQIQEVCQRQSGKVTLLGWSLGGLFAREVAKRNAESVAKVITMGSPFSGHPRANNAWRLYQFVTGHKVDAPPVDFELHVKPPAETVALWSPRDGIISPRAACGWPGERDQAVALRCTHMGFSYATESIEMILRELDRQIPTND